MDLGAMEIETLGQINVSAVFKQRLLNILQLSKKYII